GTPVARGLGEVVGPRLPEGERGAARAAVGGARPGALLRGGGAAPEARGLRGGGHQLGLQRQLARRRVGGRPGEERLPQPQGRRGRRRGPLPGAGAGGAVGGVAVPLQGRRVMVALVARGGGVRRPGAAVGRPSAGQEAEEGHGSPIPLLGGVVGRRGGGAERRPARRHLGPARSAKVVPGGGNEPDEGTMSDTAVAEVYVVRRRPQWGL